MLMHATLLLLCLHVTLVTGTSAAAQTIVPPLHTEGALILDSLSQPIKLACVNWYGAHMEEYIVNGLDAQPMDSISATIADMGFNCVRLAFSTSLYFDNPVITNNSVLAANPSLVGLHAMDIFDLVVQSLADQGLMVILNNHIGAAMWCCSEEDGEGLWYTDEFPEKMFLSMWHDLAVRYRHEPLVVGADLRNELRWAGDLEPTWGRGDMATDWAAAATRAGNEVLHENPDLLVIVEGLNYANDLTGAFSLPVELKVPNRLVYSAHDYSWQQDSAKTYSAFRDLMDAQWGGLATAAEDRAAVPVWLGEFGENTDSRWWKWIIRYLDERQFGFSYWAVDGEQRLGVDESYGLLLQDYVTVRDPWKLADLQALMR